MEAEVARLQSGLAQAEAQIADLSRDVQTLKGMFEGKQPETIRVPSGVEGFNRTYEVIAQPLGAEEAEPSAGEFNHPFKLTVATSAEGIHSWRVNYEGSTVTDGTNGDSIDLTLAGFDADNSFSADRFIVLEADVDASLVVTNWTLSAISTGSTNTAEVSFDSGTPPAQNKIRLLIGKVAVVDDSPVAYQACYTAQRITHGLLNGAAVKVFESAPVHQADL